MPSKTIPSTTVNTLYITIRYPLQLPNTLNNHPSTTIQYLPPPSNTLSDQPILSTIPSTTKHLRHLRAFTTTQDSLRLPGYNPLCTTPAVWYLTVYLVFGIWCWQPKYRQIPGCSTVVAGIFVFWRDLTALTRHVCPNRSARWTDLSIQGCQRYPAGSDAFPYGCQQLPRVFHGIVNRNEFYSQYPVFDGIGVFAGIQNLIRVLHVVVRGYCNTVEYRQILYGN